MDLLELTRAEGGEAAPVRSMTGYGAAETDLPEGDAARVEIRTVNHRHLSIRVRLPRGWESLEAGVAAQVRGALHRGSVAVSVHGPASDDEARSYSLNVDRARRYGEELAAASAALGFPGRLDAATLAGLPGVWTRAPAARRVPDGDALAECVGRALADVVAMRETEGRRLAAALRSGLERVAAETRLIASLAPARLVRERDRLRARVAALADGVDADEERLAREIAYLADRWDVAEEIVRLESHLALFSETLAGASGPRIGKRLGFVAQEMNREANTVAAKANDAAISAAAVRIKEELERVREQLENVE